MELLQSKKKNFPRHLESVCRKELFFKAQEQLHGSFRDIGAHQGFQKTEFFMPELLLKELKGVQKKTNRLTFSSINPVVFNIS